MIFLAGLAAYAGLQAQHVEVPAAARWEALRWASLAGAAFAWTQASGREHRWKWLMAALLLWITDFIHHIDPAWVALGVAVGLSLPVVGDVLDAKDISTVTAAKPANAHTAFSCG